MRVIHQISFFIAVKWRETYDQGINGTKGLRAFNMFLSFLKVYVKGSEKDVQN